MDSTKQPSNRRPRTAAVRVALPLLILLGAFIAGRTMSSNSVVGTWGGITEDQIGRSEYLAMTFTKDGHATVSIQFLPNEAKSHQKPPEPTIYRGTYFFEGGLLVQNLESDKPVPEAMFSDRPLHEAKIPTRQLRCAWKVDGDHLRMNARTPVDVVLTRVKTPRD